MIKSLPSVEYLKECFDYDPLTGSLRWRERPRCHFKKECNWKRVNSSWSGKEILSKNKDGYFVVTLKYKRYLVHRLIWKLMTGNDPEGLIDHRDNKKTNNTWSNLRTANVFQNAQNVVAYQGKGLKGAYKRWNKFQSAICVNGKRIYLGLHDTEEQAHKAYCDASKKYHGEFANVEKVI